MIKNRILMVGRGSGGQGDRGQGYTPQEPRGLTQEVGRAS